MNEDQANVQAAETQEAAAAQSAARVQELEAKLMDLLRRKYQIHWRQKGSPAGISDEDPQKQAELKSLQTEIKAVFDQIRLIDRKYKLPTFGQFD